MNLSELIKKHDDLKEDISEMHYELMNTEIDLFSEKWNELNKKYVELVSLLNSVVEIHRVEKVNRVELIVNAKRVWNSWNLKNVKISFQDNERTIKVFAEEEFKDNG